MDGVRVWLPRASSWVGAIRREYAGTLGELLKHRSRGISHCVDPPGRTQSVHTYRNVEIWVRIFLGGNFYSRNLGDFFLLEISGNLLEIWVKKVEIGC